MNRDEGEGIDACRRGDIRGLQVLYELYSGRVFRTCFRILGDTTSAEDATQEIFLRLFERIDRYGGRSAFSTWLYRLTVNYALNLARRGLRGRREMAAGPVHLEQITQPGPTPDELAVQKEAIDTVQRLLSRLPPEYRAVLVLREIEGLDYREIARVMEVPPGTVMSRLSRARAALRQKWEKLPDSGE